MKYDFLLFDMDGMLVDTTKGVLNSFRYALDEFGYPEMTQEELNRFMGPPLTYSFMNFCGFSEEDTRKAIEIYRKRYTELGQYECSLFPGVEEMLSELKERSFRMCIATSKLETFASGIAKRLKLTDYVEDVVGSNLSETISEKDEVIEECIRRLGFDRTRALMIGDRKYDVLGAKKCGMDSFGVYMGCAPIGEHEQAGATYIAHGIPELKEKLLSFF